VPLIEVSAVRIRHELIFPYDPIPMKTTLELPDDTYCRAKALTALQGQPFCLTQHDWLQRGAS